MVLVMILRLQIGQQQKKQTQTELLKAQAEAGTIGIIGGADGPTAIMLVGTIGAGSVVVEVLIGVLLIAVGIRGLKKQKK